MTDDDVQAVTMSTTTDPHVPEEEPLQEPTSQRTGTGLDENVAAALTYVLGWLTGIVMYFVESDRERVRFHAVQSIVVFGGLTVLSLLLSVVQTVLMNVLFAGGTAGFMVGGIVSAVLGLVGIVIWLGGLVAWVYLLVRTYQGKDPRLPVAAGIADRYA